jgi:hypothetical protein
MSPETQTEERMRSLAELKDAHKGRMGFVLGNGWSVTYYDTSKMKNDGILIGCNECYTKHPIDYLVWQDSHVDEICAKFDGPKITSNRKGRRGLAGEDVFFHGFTKMNTLRNQDGSVRLMHSGGIALQVAIKMGCNPIIMVGW